MENSEQVLTLTDLDKRIAECETKQQQILAEAERGIERLQTALLVLQELRACLLSKGKTAEDRLDELMAEEREAEEREAEDLPPESGAEAEAE